MNPWARLLFWAVVLGLLAVAGSCYAEFRLGTPAVAGISVCLTQEDALAVLTAEKERGKEEADKVFISSQNCANVPVEFTPKRIVASVRTSRGIGRVVEIISGEKLAYWITYQSLGFKET